MANTTAAKTIHTLDKERRTWVTQTVFPASEHTDRDGVTAWFGVEIETRFRKPSSAKGRPARYESEVVDVEVNANGRVIRRTFLGFHQHMPFTWTGITIETDRYRWADLESVASGYSALIGSAPSLAGLEAWAIAALPLAEEQARVRREIADAARNASRAA